MRLIDADVLREQHCEGCHSDIQEDCKHALTNARIKEGFYTCELTKTVPAEHFCSWAVRREDEH